MNCMMCYADEPEAGVREITISNIDNPEDKDVIYMCTKCHPEGKEAPKFTETTIGIPTEKQVAQFMHDEELGLF